MVDNRRVGRNGIWISLEPTAGPERPPPPEATGPSPRFPGQPAPTYDDLDALISARGRSRQPGSILDRAKQTLNELGIPSDALGLGSYSDEFGDELGFTDGTLMDPAMSGLAGDPVRGVREAADPTGTTGKKEAMIPSGTLDKASEAVVKAVLKTAGFPVYTDTAGNIWVFSRGSKLAEVVSTAGAVFIEETPKGGGPTRMTSIGLWSTKPPGTRPLTPNPMDERPSGPLTRGGQKILRERGKPGKPTSDFEADARRTEWRGMGVRLDPAMLELTRGGGVTDPVPYGDTKPTGRGRTISFQYRRPSSDPGIRDPARGGR